MRTFGACWGGGANAPRAPPLVTGLKLKNKSEPPAVPAPVPRERKEPEKRTEVVVGICDFGTAEKGDLSLIKVCLCKYE